jgi:dihydrodipicolinate reductase
MTTVKVGVVGASGETGQSVVDALLDSSTAMFVSRWNTHTAPCLPLTKQKKEKKKEREKRKKRKKGTSLP